jgi:hypothetical protein
MATGHISELSAIRGGMGIWLSPQFRGMGLLTHGLQSRVGRPVPLSIHRQSTDAPTATPHRDTEAQRESI